VHSTTIFGKWLMIFLEIVVNFIGSVGISGEYRLIVDIINSLQITPTFTIDPFCFQNLNLHEVFTKKNSGSTSTPGENPKIT
jgi:hypothetical protein